MKKHRGHHRGQVEPKWGRKGAGLHRGNNSPEHRKIAPSRGRRSRARY